MNNSVVRKKNKNIIIFFKKITLLNNQLENLFRHKYVNQDTYIEYMQNLNEIQDKILELETITLKKRPSKIMIENYVEEINKDLELFASHTASTNCIDTLDIYFDINEHLDKMNNEYKELFNLINDYFIPLSSVKVIDNDKFIKKHNITVFNIPIITKLIDSSKINSLMEKINGVSLIFNNNNTCYYINGYFNKDSLCIFKNHSLFKEKIKKLYDKSEYLEMPIEFKDKYLEQLPLKDFILYSIDEILNIMKNDYNDFLNYKNKSLAVLIKEFVKSSIEKQRRIITLFLLSDQEYQFTAHIIFDLITDKSFLAESQYLSDIIFNSLHWKIQQIFKISNQNFENNKKKLENITINNVPYESRILAIQAPEYIKGKAMEKLKEINGSKENSIKAQQWLDGFLKIPFNITKKEPIIDFFRNYQNRIDKYIECYTIKISEFNYEQLNINNKNIYNIFSQIIDEYHANVTNSEYSYFNFIKYLELTICSISKELGLNNNIILNNNNYNNNFNNNNNNLKINTDLNENQGSLFLLDKINDNSSESIVQKIIENNIIPTDDKINDCIKQLNHFKKIKSEISESNIINENNINTMINKINDIECMLNLNLLVGNTSNIDNNNIIENNEYNTKFKLFIEKTIDEFQIFVTEWYEFKIKKNEYMKTVDNILNKCTYGQLDAKKQMKRIIGQWMNGTSKGQCFGLCGPPGVGKTTLCKNGLAKCLFDENGETRPFAFLPLGGATNGSILEGHHYTYLGSTWGKIVDILMETKCMNPIIYIDELDKISKTEHGKEIASILTHITDQSQNKEFYDRYFTSIPIDLSQVLFIFSYNNKDDIDSILRDRIQEIPIKALTLQDKLVISQNYVIPEILNNVGFSNMEVIFTNEMLSNIINKYTYEPGVRKLNEILYDIIRDINLKKIEDIDNLIEYPIIINDILVQPILSNMPSVTMKKINSKPMIGQGTGLYALSSGTMGGITIIQVMKTLSDKKLSIEKLTGSLGDVMKESMNCSLTVAWNILPENIKNEINQSKDGFGLHIHCGDYQQKDGPSASLIQCITIISRLTNVPIKNDVAMTGEMDLQGNAKEIGGLHSKILGAYNAGVKKVLIPKDNEKDIDLIFKREEEELNEMKKLKTFIDVKSIPSTPSFTNFYGFDENEYQYNKKQTKKRFFRNEMEIVIINDIFEALEHALVPNDLVFNTDL